MENSPCRKAFLSMYHLLDHIYSQNPYKNLAVVLSDVNPYIFKGSMSADPAAWEDFCEYYEQAKEAYSTEFDAAFHTALRFLRVYEDEWGYPIPCVMEAFTSAEYQNYWREQN